MSIQVRELLLALGRGTPRSGNDLAQQFGVTRAAIWKQIEALRGLGAPIIARPGEGYALAAPLDLLDVAAIRAYLGEHRSNACAIDLHWQIDSTNSALLRRVQAGELQTQACFSELQSAGRGRRGRAWHTPLGGGLAFSISRRFDASMSSLAGLSLAVGVGVVNTLAELGTTGLGLKWPNDILVGGKKLAGILIELGGDALGPCQAVIGIGLNVRMGTQSTEQIDQPWTDLASQPDYSAPSRNQLAGQLLGRLLDVLDEFAVHGFSAFADEFSRFDVLCGHPINILAGRDRREAVAAGVDRLGNLRARGLDGEYLVDSGEVSVRAVTGVSA